MPRRPGPPSKITDTVVVRVKDEDQELPVVEAILRRVRTGFPEREACRSLGLSSTTIVDWERRGNQARQKVAAGTRLYAEDLRYLEFANALEQARAESLLRDWTTLGQLAAGGMQVKTVVEKVDADGAKTTTTTVSHTLPSERALMWRLKVRAQHLFGDRVTLAGDDESPIEVNVSAVARDLATRLRSIQDDAAGEVPELPAIGQAS